MDDETQKQRNREAQRRWRERNPGYAAMKVKEWREKNPEKAREQWRRKAARLSAKGPRRRSTNTPCVKCGVIDRFPSGACRPCTRASNDRYKRDHPEEFRERANAKARSHRARKAATDRQAFDRKWNLARQVSKLGITQEQYAAMEDAQGNRCAICGDPPTGKRFRRLAIDHCHDTGKVRGLLCHRCNLCIGQFKDDVSIIQKAIEYLKSHKEST